MYEGLLFCFQLSFSMSLDPNLVARKISDRRPVLANQLPMISSPNNDIQVNLCLHEREAGLLSP